MGISLKNQRRRSRRRSYASYQPPSQPRGARNDPFRIVFYLVAIGVGIWVYLNQDMVREEIFGGGEGREPRLSAAGDAASSQPSGNGNNTSADDLAARAQEAYLSGQLLQAVGLYRQAVEADTASADYYVQIARLLVYESAMQYGDLRLQTLDEALEAANNAVLIDPFNPAGYAIMGKVYDWQGRPDQASNTILQALDIDKDYAPAHAYLAEALVDLQRWDQARDSIDRALTLAPDNVDVRREYGYVLESLGDYDTAATQYETALRLHPRLPYLHVALGRLYRELGRNNEALDRFFEAQLISPSSALVAFEIGRTYETYIGDPNAALDYYERSTDLDANYGSPWVRMGTLRYFQGRYPEAVVAFERALALNALPSGMIYQLGLSYAYEGRCDVAMRYLDEAQTLAEGDERILDAVQTGYEVCSQPTLSPEDLQLTTTPEEEEGEGETNDQP